MKAFISQLLRNFRSASPVPEQYRKIFMHLYGDIAWYGVLSGTTIAFIAVYATRRGATNEQIGLLSAVPALVNLLFALPAGSWLARRPLGRAVFWTSIIQRSFYLLLIPLPVMLMPDEQVWVILGVTLLMNVPAVAVTVGFNSLFGEVVPLQWRGHVVGYRNALLSIITTVFTLFSGWLLDRMTFPTGYQVVFGVGVIGAVMSSVHLYYLSRIAETTKLPVIGGTSANTSQAGAAGRRLAVEIRGLYQRGLQSLRLDAMRGKFSRIMGLLFFWHMIQFMTIPTVTPFIVNDLKISDQLIGLAGGLFNIAVFAGSLRLNRATSRFGNHKVTGIGIMGLSIFPIGTSLGIGGYIGANLAGGFAWSMAGGALYNYILDNIPAGDRPAHMAWYSLVSNAAILIGSLAGPAIAGRIGYVPALLIFGIGRFIAGAAILRWG